MDIQEKEALISEIERFKEEALKMHIVQVLAHTYTITSLFDYSIDSDGSVIWYKAQACQLWDFWQDAKAQAVPAEFEIGQLKDRITELLDERQDLYAQINAQAVPEQVLDAPACVGAGTFQKGVKWSTVIAAAQRHFKYTQNAKKAPSLDIDQVKKLVSGDFVLVEKSKVRTWYQDDDEPENFCNSESDLDCLGDCLDDDDIIAVNIHESAHISTRKVFGVWKSNSPTDIQSKFILVDSHEEAEKIVASNKAMIEAQEPAND